MAVALDLNEGKSKKKKILKELTVKTKSSVYNQNAVKLQLFNADRNDGAIYIPLYQYPEYFEEYPYAKEDYPRCNLPFYSKLLTKETDPSGRGRDQDIVVKDAISRLREKHSVFISAFTGFGKSATGIYLMCYFCYKTVILCHNNTIKKQWIDEIDKHTRGRARIQVVSGKKPFDPKAHVYIVGVLKAKTIPREDVLHVGMVIIDEAHICTITAFTQSLLRFQPRYLVGLSATPERADGMQKLLEVYFGPKKEFIYRFEKKDFTVVKLTTSYQPEISYITIGGKTILNWTEMMTKLSGIKERWMELADRAVIEKKHKIIMMCDRNEMAQNIFEYIEKKGDSAELYIGTKKTWDKSKRILITNVKKGAVGLNDPTLTMLILCCDMKNVKQCEGRIRTTNNVVIDCVDDLSTLENHWGERRKWYERKGATIIEEGPRAYTIQPKSRSKKTTVTRHLGKK